MEIKELVEVIILMILFIGNLMLIGNNIAKFVLTKKKNELIMAMFSLSACILIAMVIFILLFNNLVK